MKRWTPGTRGMINRGAFANFSAVVVSHDEQLIVDVDIFGRRTPVRLEPDDFDGESDDVDPMQRIWRQIAEDRLGSLNVRRSHWWARAARDGAKQEDPQELLERFEAFEVELDRELAEVRERFHARFDPLSFRDRATRWRETREQWLVPREEFRALVDRLEDELLTEVIEVEEERAKRLRTLWDAGHYLRRDTERAVRNYRREDEPVGERDPRTDPIARDLGLERAIAEDPGAKEPYQIYGDYLESHGDPRGELISVQIAGNREYAEQLIHEHHAYFLGSLRNYLGPLQLEWEHGFIAKARIALTYEDFEDDIECVPLLRSLLDLPSARFLRSLTLGIFDYEGDNDYHELVGVLVERPQASLRELFIGDTTAEQQEISWTSAGDLSGLPRAVPKLRSLRVHAGSMVLGSLDLPELVSLRIETGGLSQRDVRSLDAGTWPKLEELRIWFGRETYGAGGTIDDIRRILTGEGIPSVRRLGLMNAEFTDEIAEAIVETPLLARLEELDLSLGVMSDRGANALLSATSRWRHLRKLVVSQNYLPAASLDRLREIGPEIVSSYQNQDEIYQGQIHRYPSIGE